MGFFKRTRTQPTGKVRDDPFTDDERVRVRALWRLTALPRDEFEATYGAMLARFWRYAAAARGEAWTALRSEALTCAVAALRARQARVLPRFAAAEDAARLAEVMSFALATAVVAERFGLLVGRAAAPGWSPLTADVPAAAMLTDAPPPAAYGLLLVARLAGDAGLAWLGQEPVALAALAAYFGPGPSELRTIAEEAKARVGVPAPQAPPPDRDSSNARLHQGTPPSVGAAATAPDRDSADAGAPVAGEAPPGRIGGKGGGWDWINWVRDGLRDGGIPVNADGGWLHNLGGDAYVVVPDGYRAFAESRGVGAKTVMNRVKRLGRHRARGGPSGVVNTFRARLADGRRVAGMAFPGELLWDSNAPPEGDVRLEQR